MRESARLARAYGVTLHTHLAETRDEEDFCLAQFGARPGAYAEQLEWVGSDVWWAHSIHVNPAEIALMARTQTGAAHCPCSNMRLASGIAPVRAMLDERVPVGLGVDGSASNDGSHMLNEARQALLLQRVLGTAQALTGEEALWLATRGGASVLRRDDVGQLAPGMAADVVAFDLTRRGTPAPNTIPRRRCSSAPRSRWTFPSSMAGLWWRMANCARWPCRHLSSAITRSAGGCSVGSKRPEA